MSRKSKDTTPAPPAPEPLWSARATGGGRGTHLGVRWFIAALLILFLAGVTFRAFFATVSRTTINEAPKVTVSSVGEYAAAFARDWFTWTDGNTAERATRLSAYNPNLQITGWNGKGNQTVTDARVFAQADLDNNEHRVTIRVSVDTSPAPFYVDVLAIQDGSKYAVVSVPSLVSGPPLAGMDMAPQPAAEQDTSINDAITSQLKLFFTSYATGDEALNTLVLSGKTIVPIGGGVTFKSLDSVFVPALDKNADTTKRTVTAEVTWTFPNGTSTAAATYSVDLELQAGKWFVASVRGGVPDSKIAPAQSADSKAGPRPTSSAGGGTTRPGTSPAPSGTRWASTTGPTAPTPSASPTLGAGD